MQGEMQPIAVGHPLPTDRSSRRLVLVVEPDEEARELYGRILRSSVSEIEYAEDGRDALAKAIGQKPGVVITETRLAFINGYTLCSLLRADPITADATIIVVTVDVSPFAAERALASGADRVLSKACAPDALLWSIARTHNRSRTLAARSESTPTRTVVEDRADVDPVETTTKRARRCLSSAHRRFETSAPPANPPCLFCPSCGRRLRYVRSHIGGVSARRSEQWDYYVCANTCGSFQYRQRTRRLRRIG